MFVRDTPVSHVQMRSLAIEDRYDPTEAGFTGLGFIADDLLAVRDTIGFSALRQLISDHGLTHVEIELIER